MLAVLFQRDNLATVSLSFTAVMWSLNLVVDYLSFGYKSRVFRIKLEYFTIFSFK